MTLSERPLISRVALLAGVTAAIVAALVAGSFTSAARAAGPSTVVSLTFDDGTLDQYTNALPALQQSELHATFYIITGYVGVNSAYMTLPQVRALASAGNEIGGHTVLHPYLTQLTSDEAKREICQSRDSLLGWGFQPTDFAYPYSDYNAAVEGIVQQCGFNSGRLDENLASPYACAGCDVTESIPPADPYAINTPDSVKSNWTLSDLKNLVTGAEQRGGWLPIVFHHVCDNNCDRYSISTANFSAFLAWLKTQNVSVQTVSQVMGGPVSAPVSARPAPPAPPGVNGVADPSLETADQYNTGFPQCWVRSGSGTNAASYARTSAARTGSVAETVTISSFTSGDARLITKQDLGQCAPGAVPGDAYVASAWYHSTTRTRFVLWYRDTNGGWHYWTQGPVFAASGSWAQARWTTPAVPAGATGLSFGLNLAAVGSLTTDDYSLVDSAGAPAPPSVTLTAPSGGAGLTGQVTLSASASAGAGISKVDFLVNGAVVASKSSAPYSVSWDSSTVGDGPVTITARVTDSGGNAVTSAGVAATVSNAASRGGNMLANASLETAASGSVPDCWQLGGTGTNTYSWARVSNAHTGSWAERVTITALTRGDRKLVSSQLANACSPRVTPGSTYHVSAWYESTQPAHIVLFYLNSSGKWAYWTQSPAFAASGSWAQAAWTTPPVPAGATAMGFGLNLAAVGSLTTDDYSMIAG